MRRWALLVMSLALCSGQMCGESGPAPSDDDGSNGQMDGDDSSGGSDDDTGGSGQDDGDDGGPDDGGSQDDDGGATGPPLPPFSGENVLVVGNPKVTVIEYGDFQCPVCGSFFAETYPTIKAEYVETGRVRWVFRQFPLRAIHPLAEGAAQASECAADQDEFFAYHDLLFTNQPALTNADLKAYASQLGLDTAEFDACLDGGGKADEVQEDVDAALDAGATGTPTFVIEGETHVGFQSVDAFRALLDDALDATGG